MTIYIRIIHMNGTLRMKAMARHDRPSLPTIGSYKPDLSKKIVLLQEMVISPVPTAERNGPTTALRP